MAFIKIPEKLFSKKGWNPLDKGKKRWYTMRALQKSGARTAAREPGPEKTSKSFEKRVDKREAV